MNEAGELIEWNDAKGFGFVRSRNGDRLFVHATAFERAVRRPEIGDRLLFQRGPGRDGRPSVVVAQIAGARPRMVVRGPSPERVEQAQSARFLRIALAAGLLLALVVTRNIGRAPDWLVWIYVAMGVASAAIYWLDKEAAETGGWRQRESTLHSLDLIGGIVGGLLAQAALRHKTAKREFVQITLVIVAAHAIFLGALGFGLMHLPPWP
jgi:uncharacterized membrane protein YsdA (DUF1294 family)/cold shock CspA family protein